MLKLIGRMEEIADLLSYEKNVLWLSEAGGARSIYTSPSNM